MVWLWLGLSEEMLLFVLLPVAAGCPNAVSGSCHSLNLPVIWGSETGSKEVR